MCLFKAPATPEIKTTAAHVTPTAVSTADVNINSKQKAAETTRRKAGFDSTIVGSAPAALTQQATDAMKTKMG